MTSTQLDFTEQLVIPPPFRGDGCVQIEIEPDEYQLEASCVFCHRFWEQILGKQPFECKRELYLFGRKHKPDENPGLWSQRNKGELWGVQNG